MHLNHNDMHQTAPSKYFNKLGVLWYSVECEFAYTVKWSCFSVFHLSADLAEHLITKLNHIYTITFHASKAKRDYWSWSARLVIACEQQQFSSCRFFVINEPNVKLH